jgi:CrcB protein
VTPLLAIAVVATGAAATLLRYGVSLAFARSRFPWAVLTVNVIGSLIGGAVLGLAERAAIADDLRLVLLTGLCGGLTTFSTFGVETIQLVQDGRARVAALSVAANLVVGIGAAALAYLLLR